MDPSRARGPHRRSGAKNLQFLSVGHGQKIHQYQCTRPVRLIASASACSVLHTKQVRLALQSPDVPISNTRDAVGRALLLFSLFSVLARCGEKTNA
ncbi:hypothetical protein NDU88_005834 [Pleurodeles waltl]|uniref:Uncharacterized protein n=1 Tax=Pleurodeles waltl TaxID=8319 RepID=A0AAV7QJ09_PLEWA|nr:hypothetical protein NDU88_005834 [Pleurodeles waltl]